MFARYPAIWEKIDRQLNPTKYNQPTNVDNILGTVELPAKSFTKMASVHRDECNIEMARWLLDHDRPRAVAQDEGLHALLRKIQLLPGMYEPPDDQELARSYRRQGILGEDAARSWVVRVQAEGRKISIAGDIWTDGELSMLAIVGYVILDGFIWSKQVLAVVEFSKLKHTACQIQKKTIEALKSIGMVNTFEDVWRKVSDAGSNMKKGWSGFDGGNQTCADHKIERSVHVYNKQKKILAMCTKRHAAATHMKYSTTSKNDINESQELLNAAINKATRSNETRWRSAHAEARWFRIHEDDMLDAKYCSGNEVLEDKLLNSCEQQLNNEQEAILFTAARVSLGLESDNEPTLSLVIPYIDSILYNMHPVRDVKMVAGEVIKSNELEAASQEARADTHADFQRRWVDEIDDDYLATLKVASVCDPRHKQFKLRSYSRSARSALAKDAWRLAKAMYDMNYAPDECDALVAQSSNESVDKRKSTTEPHMKKQITVDVSDLLGREDESEEEVEEVDEWEKYFRLPQVAATTDLLTWWRENEDSFPNIAKMAKQVLGCPACSSGVERLFSKAGRNHTDLQQHMKEVTMRSILFAINCSWKLHRQ